MDITLYEVDQRDSKLVITNRTQLAPPDWFRNHLTGVPEFLLEGRVFMVSQLSLPSEVEMGLHLYQNSRGEMFAA